MLLDVRDMSIENHMPLSEMDPSPLHFTQAPVFVFYSIQVSTNMPSNNIPIRILINFRSWLTFNLEFAVNRDLITLIQFTRHLVSFVCHELGAY